MSESDKDEIERLLSEGLDYYGGDEVAQAILTWEKVIALDPGNEQARDYIQTADRRSVPRPKPGEAPPPAEASSTGILDDALQCVAQEDYEAAFDFLGSADAVEQSKLDFQATHELVRSQLLSRYRKSVGALESVPEMRADSGSITKFNLPPDAGFVLSLVDGQTSVGDMISVSGMDPFDAFRILQGLLCTEIVSMRE